MAARNATVEDADVEAKAPDDMNNAHPGPSDLHDATDARDDDDDDDNADDDSAPMPPTQDKNKQKQPSRFGPAAVMAKLGLNKQVLVAMFKGSLPPLIGIGMLQSPPVARYFLTLGYLIPIVSILGLAMLPRGKFLQSLVLNVFAVCLGAAVAMLALWSSVKAREHTTPPGQSPIDPATRSVRYNSSQSAVCAVWLFANIWLVNVMRARFPAVVVPVILYSILANIASTFGARIPTVPAAEHFVKELFTAMLTGLAISTGVNLLVVPISSRMVVFAEFAGAVGLLKKAVGLQRKYLVGLEELDMFAVVTHQATIDARKAERRYRKMSKKDKKAAKGKPVRKPPMTKVAAVGQELKAAIAQVREMSGKIQADVAFAKRDVAWGKLDAKDVGEVARLIRNASIPVAAMASIMDIFQRVAERRGWNVDAAAAAADEEDVELLEQKEGERRVWNEVMKRMHVPFEILSEAVDQGVTHAALRLEILPRPKVGKGADVEAKGGELKPGDDGFAALVRQKILRFESMQGEALQAWVKERELWRGADGVSTAEARERDQAQLYCLLYMERLMQASGEAALDLVAFAEKKVADGTMARNRLIFPSQRRLRKWAASVFSEEDQSAEQSPDALETGLTVVYVGDGYNKKKDPEHLPPTSAWQRAGNVVRKISAFFSSEECAFGFRVAAATMTIGIVAFLEKTQSFFIAQRLVWAMIMIAIGMTMTSGQSIFGLFCRVGGTVIAMVLSYIIWYIVDGKTAGVIVFLWVALFVEVYFLVKYPRFTPAVLITLVTQVLIIGYELQVRKIGEAAASSSGQPFFPIYKLAPFRLATVAGGCFVAFIWTVFPSPLTDSTWLRRDLSAGLYLVANYYSVITSGVRSQIDGTAGSADVPGTPAHELRKIRLKIFGKMLLLLPSMAAHADWQKWEPTVGGKFPRAAYEDVIARTTRIMSYLTFMSYTMNHPPPTHVDMLERTEVGGGSATALGAPTTTAQGSSEDPAGSPSTPPATKTPAPEAHTPADNDNEPLTATTTIEGQTAAAAADRDWLNALSSVLREISPSHHNIVSTLMLLSNSLLTGHSLPPFLPVPRPYEMTRALLRLERRGVATATAAAKASSPSSSSNSSQQSDSDDDDSEDSEIDLPPLMIVNSRTGLEVRDDVSRQEKARLRRRRRRRSRGTLGGGGGGGGTRVGRDHVLDPANVERPGYAEFAVLEICSTLVCDDLEGLIRSISGLVGVVDFSYRVGGSVSSFGSGSGSDGDRGKGKVD